MLSAAIMVSAALFTSCEKENTETGETPGVTLPDNQPSEEELLEAERQALIDSLTFGGKYVSRTWHDYTGGKNPYVCVDIQKEYRFDENGKGLLTTYLMDDTDRGYVMIEDSITWSLSATKPFALKITERENATISLEEVKVTVSELSSKTSSWHKEIEPWEGFCKEDVISYSVEGLNMWHGHSGYGEPLVWATPATLTVKTVRGTMRFIRSHCSDCIVGYRQPYDIQGDDFIPADCDIYFSVCEGQSSFYDIFLQRDPFAFVDAYPWGSTLVSYNFNVGIALGEVVAVNSNGEEYTVQN